MNNLVRRVFLISIFATAIMTTFGVFELARADGLTMKQQERAFESSDRMLKDQAKVRISDKGFLARHERKQREKMQQAIFYTVVFFALLPALIFLAILILKPEQKQKIQSHIMATAHFFVTRQGAIILAVVHIWLLMALLFYLLS
jgi:thiosulfate reductase cytochrome b subunit